MGDMIMTLDEILNIWEKDSKIDRTDISSECLKVPELHHKYLKIMSHESLLLKKLENDRRTLFKLKWEYYLGNLDKETLDEKGWQPMRLKILKNDIDVYMDSDVDLQTLDAKIAVQKEKTTALESILRSISMRSYTLKNYIDFEKFQVGAI